MDKNKLKEQAFEEVAGPILKKIGFTQGLFLGIVIMFPFVWIWFNIIIAVKLLLTGIIGILITKFIYKIVKDKFKQIIDSEIDKNIPTIKKSKFAQRLDEMSMKKSGQEDADEDIRI